MSALEGLIINLQAQGIFDLYLPFLLTFSIFFALLEKSRVFGEDMAKINALVAFVAGFYVMFYSPVGIEIGQFFAMFFAETSVVLVSLLVFLMVISLLMGPFLKDTEGWEKLGKKVIPLVMILGLILTFAMFSSSGGIDLFARGLGGGSLGINLSSEDITLIILVVVTLVAIWWLVGSGGSGKADYLKIPTKKG